MFYMWLLSRQVCSPLVFFWTVVYPACFALLILRCFVMRSAAGVHSWWWVGLKWTLPASYNYRELINLGALIIIIQMNCRGMCYLPPSSTPATSVKNVLHPPLSSKTLAILRSENLIKRFCPMIFTMQKMLMDL